MQISGVSLTLTWPCRLHLLRVLLGMMPLLQAFAFPSTLGEVTLHPRSQACVFIYSLCGKWVFPPLLWSFPSTTAFTSFPTPYCWVCAAAPDFSGWLFYLQLTWELVFPSLLWSFPPTTTLTSFPTPGCWVCAATPTFCSGLVRDFPSLLLQHSGCPAILATCLLCCYCLLLSFSFFPMWGLACPGGYADVTQGCVWEYHIQLSSPYGLHLPKLSGCRHLAVVQEPSWLLRLT
jgi:hypothetical protein